MLNNERKEMKNSKKETEEQLLKIEKIRIKTDGSGYRYGSGECECCGHDLNLIMETDGGYKYLGSEENTGSTMCLECGQIYFITSSYTDIETLNEERLLYDKEETTDYEVFIKRLNHVSKIKGISKVELVQNWISILEKRGMSS